MACDCIHLLAPQLVGNDPLITLPNTLIGVPKAKRVVINTGELKAGPGKPISVAMFTGPCPICGANHKNGKITAATRALEGTPA